MAEALIKGIISAGLCNPQDIFISDIRAERLDFLTKEYGVTAVATNSELAGKVNILVLSVKPQNMVEALESIRDAARAETLIISIAAGIKVSNISAVLGEVPIVRVMPNTPALIGEGASALFANEKAKPTLSKAEKIFASVGKAVTVDDESLIDAVTAVSGSGPAYYFLLTEEMIRAAGELGLPEDVAKDLVLQTAKGAALLAVERDKQGETAAELRRKVTSPGGTTEAALKVFAAKDFSRLVNEALTAARDRSKQLSG
ncbi:MAG: pyrroline-5-carboxylate reductase [Planctomycetota bacterium]|nr:MAG: pyrroline-5-carboxylate reductase [Planctomycetota bacterium]